MTRIAACFAALLLAVAGCGDDDEGAAPDTTVTTRATTSSSAPGGSSEPCESPAGFTIAAPVGWATNDGNVLPPCSLFDAEPFEVPEGTDERVAAISASVEPVAFETAAQGVRGRDVERRDVDVDGRRAVRLAYEATGEGLYPEGTPITTYLVDFPGDGEATLIVDTVGTGSFDYEANVAVLDRMVASLEIRGGAGS